MDVLLADKRAAVRSAVRLVLAHEPGISLIAEVETGDELLARIEAGCPDLLLLDWELPGQPLPEVLSTLRQRCPHLQVIALSGHPEVRRLALEAGVDQFVCKANSPDQLLAAIRSVRPASIGRGAPLRSPDGQAQGHAPISPEQRRKDDVV